MHNEVECGYSRTCFLASIFVAQSGNLALRATSQPIFPPSSRARSASGAAPETHDIYRCQASPSPSCRRNARSIACISSRDTLPTLGFQALLAHRGHLIRHCFPRLAIQFDHSFARINSQRLAGNRNHLHLGSGIDWQHRYSQSPRDAFSESHRQAMDRSPPTRPHRAACGSSRASPIKPSDQASASCSRSSSAAMSRYAVSMSSGRTCGRASFSRNWLIRRRPTFRCSPS